MLPNLSITKYSNDRTISTVSFIVTGRPAADTVMGGSAADTVMGRSAVGGPQVVQHSCMGTAVLYNLCGSAAVAKLQLPSSQPVQA